MTTETTNETKTTVEAEIQTPRAFFSKVQGEAALEAIMPYLDDIQPDQARKLMVSPAMLVSLGLSYANQYSQDRGLFLKTFNKEVFDVEEYDNIADRAKGFWQADIKLRQLREEQGPIAALMEQAKPLRAKLLKAAEYLWSDDPSLGPIVAEIRSRQSYMNKGDDLGALATLFVEHWEDVQSKCAVTEEDVIRASDLGASILAAMGAADSTEVSDVRETRNLAAEYLRRGIEAIGAAAAFAFRNDPESLNRYPRLSIGKKKQNGKQNGDSEVRIPLKPITESEGIRTQAEETPNQANPAVPQLSQLPASVSLAQASPAAVS
jgi:hypothetical protein